MLVFATDSELGMLEVSSYCAARAFEFGIAKNGYDGEPTFAVYAMDASGP
jgi:hypothetical protein